MGETKRSKGNTMIQKLKFFLEKNRYIKQIVLFVYMHSYGKIQHYQENRRFLKNAQNVLLQVDKVFKTLELDYWLDFGTLLGAYRNKDFLKHDLDLDFGMYLAAYDEKNELVFNRFGFKKTRSFLIDDGLYGREESYEYLGVSIDIFYYTQCDTHHAYYHDFRPMQGLSRDLTIAKRGGLIPRELTLALESIGEIDFLAGKYPIPEPVEKHLSDRYGQDFMIENKSWNTDNAINQNIKLLENKIGIRTCYV